ncbi:hypothetical protein VTJ49DRAFT_7746 [Mycothermus thermophilus]|uniref:Uncharacterized protein n=1 Tax=Humicola insolens TaxID=85995 RepID=A0ABR3VH88_HUMIN
MPPSTSPPNIPMSSSPDLPPLSRTRSHRSIFREDFTSSPSFFSANHGNTTTTTIPPPTTATSSRPNIINIHRLASDHNFVFAAHPAPNRLGFWPFLVTHLSLPACFGAGIICVAVAIAYTVQLTKRALECPSWATNCDDIAADGWTVSHLATIQGVVAMVYLIGMAALARAALGVGETAVWGVLRGQSFTVRGLDAFLKVTRGEVVAVPRAVGQVRTVHAALVLVVAVVVVLLPFAGLPMVGYAFTPVLGKWEVEGNYTVGSQGVGEVFERVNSSTNVVMRVMGKYTAWAEERGEEPLEEYREWYVDREGLREKGEFTARAVRLRTGVDCRPYHAEQLARGGVWRNAFVTNMTRGNTAEVWVRPQPQLAVWADAFEFASDRRTRATLVFAAINGTIEGGEVAPLSIGNLTSVSAMACDVDVEAIEGILSVKATGEGDSDSNTQDSQADSGDLPTLSSLSTLTLPSSAPDKTRLNELLLWFTLAPLLTSPGIDGAQPMFANLSTAGYTLPHPLTSNPWEETTSTAADVHAINTWTIPGLTHFIRVSIGALAQTTVTAGSQFPVISTPPTIHTMTTRPELPTLSRPRALLLLLLPLLAITLTLLLTLYTSYLHTHHAIPVLRPFSLGELLKSSQTRWAREVAGADAAKAYLPNELGGVKVRFGMDEDGVGGFIAAEEAVESLKQEGRRGGGSSRVSRGSGGDERGGGFWRFGRSGEI